MPYRPEHKLVYEAAHDFVQRCLLGNTSLLWPERTAWTATNVAEVKRRMVDSPDIGGGSYEEKLYKQMSGASAEQWIILADATYLYYLPSISFKLETKQQQVDWARSQAALPPLPDRVWDAQQSGFVRTGLLYHKKVSQIWFILLLAHHLKQERNASAILADPGRLQATLDGILDTITNPRSRAADMRHALLFMLFPQHYERIISTRDKDTIIRTFGVELSQPLPDDRDGALLAIRQELSQKYGEQYDYYQEPVKSLWKAGGSAAPPPGTAASRATKDPPPALPQPADRVASSDVDPVLWVLAHTRNVILYGPPGTGKTYLARRVADALVEPQLQEALPEAARIQRVAAELPFYEIVALALYQAGRERPQRVKDILDAPLVQARLQASPVKYPRESIWNNLQSHTSPDSATVKVTRRFEPYLFDKDDESRWCLTAEGRVYVENNLADSLHDLREPSAPTTTPADYVVWTTFHQSYAYEDFVEGIRPKSDDSGELSYPVVPGPLLQLAKRAATQPDKHFVLVIDEINRGNIAKVFGELITLLEDDKRGTLIIRLPYSGQSFSVPPNLYVLGTMNTADRGIALLDVALRRRFAFVDLTPRPELLAGTTVGGPEVEVNLDAILRGLNSRIRPLLGRDYEIGHSYLLKVKAAPPHRQIGTLEFVWNNQIVPLLHEYFYSQPDQLRQVLAPFGEEEQASADGSVASDFGHAVGDDLLFALQGLAVQ
jgi:DNA polymerase III delta prime subunit